MKIFNINKIEIIPKKLGIYFLFSHNKLLYIGRSKNIYRRIKSHIFPTYLHLSIVNPKEIKKFAFILSPNIDINKFDEQQLINIIPTKFNGCKNWYKHNINSIVPKDIEDKIMKVEL